MITHTQAFKENIIEYGREIDIYGTATINNTSVDLDIDNLNNVSWHYEGNILKSVMKELTLDSNVELPKGTTINNLRFGVKVRDDDTVEDYRENYDYILIGQYTVETCEKQEDTNSYLVKCYDSMIKSMIDYEPMNITYPITIRNYLIAICNHLGITYDTNNGDFTNYDKILTEEKYLSYDEDTQEWSSLEYKFRDVLDELAQVTASTICINANNELEIRYITNTGETINEEFLNEDNVTFKEQFGPINTVVLSRAGGSDKIFKCYPEDLSDDEKIAIEISENQIMNGNNRDEYLDEIFTRLYGLQFYLNDFTSKGIGYLEICDRYNIEIGENLYSCVMLNDEFNVMQGVEEIIHTEPLEESVTDYSRSDKTDRKVNQAYIIADKQKAENEALTRRVNTLENETANMYTIEEVDQLIQNAETGLTNTFSRTGGNNILRNTGLWFKDENDNFEFWTGTAVKGSNDNAINSSSIILQNGSFSQEQKVPNGLYTLSFNYRLLNPLATASVKINDIEYSLNSETIEFFYTGEKNLDGSYKTQPLETTTKSVKVEFICDIDNAVEVYDLMCNVGETYLTYTQNENETTTDTVNISKGITITSTNMETIFKANANGIRILTLQNSPIAYFTDKGLSTKELIVENEAQIVKVLFQEVGDQTWLTRI